MAKIDRANNQKYTARDYAQVGLTAAKLGAAGYGAYKAYQLYKGLSGLATGAKDIYTGSLDAMKAKGDLQMLEMSKLGSLYQPSVPGGFPSGLGSPTTPFFTPTGTFPSSFK
jgi:hypothetical protein